MRYALYDGGVLLAGQAVDRMPTTQWSETGFREPDGGIDLARSLVTTLPGGRVLVVGTDPESIERVDDRMVPMVGLAFGLMVLIGIAGR